MVKWEKTRAGMRAKKDGILFFYDSMRLCAFVGDVKKWSLFRISDRNGAFFPLSQEGAERTVDNTTKRGVQGSVVLIDKSGIWSDWVEHPLSGKLVKGTRFRMGNGVEFEVVDMELNSVGWVTVTTQRLKDDSPTGTKFVDGIDGFVEYLEEESAQVLKR